MNQIDIELEWNKLMGYINTYISAPRKDLLISLYEKMAERVCTAPASSTKPLHGCYAGGYIVHVNNVIACAIKQYELWSSSGVPTATFTLEELVFAAINHDLGKCGSIEEPYYIPHDSDWHVSKGMVYKSNPALNFIMVPDRSILLLQQHGVQFSENEFLAIRLHDGIYTDANKPYYMAGIDNKFKTPIVEILHHADVLATRVEEYNQLRRHSIPTDEYPFVDTVSTSIPAVTEFDNAFKAFM